MNMMQLVCFLAVAETLNFARAAEQLHVTQPAVTQQIHSLEAEMNIQLFRRTTRTVELTQEGLIFLGDAKAMVEIYQRAKKRAESVQDDVRESFIVGCHSNNDIFCLQYPLAQMRTQFANVYPVFRVIPFQHLYQRLSEEAVDVVMAFRESGLKKTIHYQELLKVPVVGIVKKETFFTDREELQLDDLKQGPMIILDPQKCPEEYRRLLHRLLGECSPMNVYFCDSLEGAVTLALAGFGVAMVPGFFWERDVALRYLPITDVQPLSYGVYYKSLTGHPLRRTFVKMAKESFKDAHLCL